MREARASAGTSLDASPQRCLALVADVEAYPRWYREAVRRVAVLERDASGYASRVRVLLKLGLGPAPVRLGLNLVPASFEELMVVRVDPPSQVRLERVPHDEADPERFAVSWCVQAGPPARVELELAAALEVPRVVPVGRLAQSLAHGFVAAASRALSPPSPRASATNS